MADGFVPIVLFLMILGTIVLWVLIARETHENPTTDRAEAIRDAHRSGGRHRHSGSGENENR